MDDPMVTPQANNSVTTRDWKTATDDEIFDVDLMIALELDTLSEEDQIEFVTRMAHVVQKAAAARIYDSLSPELQQELAKQLEMAQDGNLEAFMEQHVPNYDAIMRDEMITFKRAMLTGEVPQE